MHFRRRRQRQQHTAAQIVLRNPLHILDRIVDVVEVDQADPGAAHRRLGAELGQPAIVRAHPRQLVLILLWRRRRRDVERRVVEGRNGVGKDHLADHAIAQQIGKRSCESQFLLFLEPTWLFAGFL